MDSTTTATYEKDATFDNILTCFKFGIGLISATVYGIEKARRLPIVIAKAANVPENVTALADSKLTFVGDLFKYASYGIMAIEFFDPIFREEGKLLWIDLKKESQMSRRLFGIITFTLIGAVVVGLAYSYWGTIKEKKRWASNKAKAWERPISIVSNGFVFVGGIIQLITLIQNWEYYKKRKLFSISSLVINLSAPVEFYGIDTVLYKAEKRGLVYIGVYGMRTLAKVTQSVGLLTMEKE